VFVNSMSDLFHARVTDDFIRRVFEVMETTPRHTYQLLTKRPRRVARLASKLPWPTNIWMGVSIEDDTETWRADELRCVPAAVRFVSAEPLLGRLDGLDFDGMDWLIAGGESGPRWRPVEAEWVDDLRQRCARDKVAFFFKQWGGRTPKANGRLLNGRTFDEMPVPTKRWRPRTVGGQQRQYEGRCWPCSGGGVAQPARARRTTASNPAASSSTAPVTTYS
jgi:protein gp37